MKQLLILIVYVITGINSCVFVQAQEQEKHEISISVASGLSTVWYDLPGGKRDNHTGGAIGVGYGFFFNDYWGITVGGEISRYSAKARMQPFSGDDHVYNRPFTYHYDVNGYHEDHELVVISIPLMFQYQASLLSDEHFCYVAIGGKIGLPWWLKYNTSEGAAYTTTGISHADNMIIDSPESEGFGVFTEKRNSHFVDYKTSYMLSVEAGMKWSLSYRFFLYTGVYCDYGLNDLIKGDTDRSFVSYNQNVPSTIFHHSLLESSYGQGQNGDMTNFTDKVTPFAIGLKVKFTFMPPGKCY